MSSAAARGTTDSLPYPTEEEYHRRSTTSRVDFTSGFTVWTVTGAAIEQR